MYLQWPKSRLSRRAGLPTGCGRGERCRLLVEVNWARQYLFREYAACRILPSEAARPE